jgi:hypothetical protein
MNWHAKEWEHKQYTAQCLHFRIERPWPFLKEIKDALLANIGIRESPYLVSFETCQVEEIMSVDNMRRYVVYEYCQPDETFFHILWKIVEKMSKAFLRFITATT